jgi:hypothetical protein
MVEVGIVVEFVGSVVVVVGAVVGVVGVDDCAGVAGAGLLGEAVGCDAGGGVVAGGAAERVVRCAAAEVPNAQVPKVSRSRNVRKRVGIGISN